MAKPKQRERIVLPPLEYPEVPRVVGVDVSLAGLGLCHVTGDRKAKINAGLTVEVELLEPKKGLDEFHRAEWLVRSALSWLADVINNFGVDVVVFEGYGFMTKSYAFARGEVGGFLRRAPWLLGLAVADAQPATLKKLATGKGNAEKEIVMREAYKRWGFEHDSHDVVDAFVAARVGALLLADPSALTTLEASVLEATVVHPAPPEEYRCGPSLLMDYLDDLGSSVMMSGSKRRVPLGSGLDRILCSSVAVAP